MVVGAGAAGGIVAEQLALGGLRVVLLERGRWQKFSETGHDELQSQRTTVLDNAFGPDDENYVPLAQMPDGSIQKVLPSEDRITLSRPASAAAAAHMVRESSRVEHL